MECLAASNVFPAVPGQLVQQHPDRCFSGCLETEKRRKTGLSDPFDPLFCESVVFLLWQKGTWLEHGRIFSIKKIILQLDLFSIVVVDVTQIRSYLYTSTILLLCQLSKAMFEAFSHSHPQNEQRQTPGGPWLVQYRHLHHTNWWIPMETLRTTYKYQFRSLILHVHTTSENPQLWALSNIGLSQKLTFAHLLQYFVWDIQVDQGKHRWHLTLKNRYQWDPAAWEDRPMAAPSKRSPAELFNNTVAYHGSEGADGLA